MKIGLPKNVPHWGGEEGAALAPGAPRWGCFLGERAAPGLGPPPVFQGRALAWAGGGGQHAGGWGGWRKGPVSLEVPVLQVAVLKGEAFLLPLAPLLVVKVDVGALARGEGGQ